MGTHPDHCAMVGGQQFVAGKGCTPAQYARSWLTAGEAFSGGQSSKRHGVSG
jgi:hypothetical protein